MTLFRKRPAPPYSAILARTSECRHPAPNLVSFCMLVSTKNCKEWANVSGLTAYLGYATCYAWTFCMSSIYEFGGAPTVGSFMLRVLPGMLAGALMLALTCNEKHTCGAIALTCFMRTPAPAFLTSLGTLLTIMPEFSQLPNLAISGCICAGFFFLFVLAQWALVFARLEWGRILSLSGISFFVAALIAFAVAWMPLNAAAFITSLLPLVGFAFLRAIPGDSSPNAGCSFACSSRASSDPHCKPCDPAKMDGSPLRQGHGFPTPHTLPWKTFAGLFSIFFAYNGIVATRAVGQSWLGNASVSFLILPAALALAFVGLGRLCTGKRSLSLVAKGALATVALPFMLVAYAMEVPAGFAFADGLAMYATAWSILVLAVKDAGQAVGIWNARRALAVFCLGWLAQTLGGALTYLVAPLAHASEMLYAFLMVAFVIVAGIEFFTAPRQAGTVEQDHQTEGEMAVQDASPLQVNANTTQSGAIESFCSKHDLSPRETEVFALWVTGHGVRDIAQKLYMSESTAKTHVRHIYDKCGVYGKAKLLQAFETWTSHQ